MTALGYGRIQLKIMQILWDRKHATAREVSDELNKTESIVFRNVQTLLKTLEGKGVVAHVPDGRSNVYSPLVNRENGIRDSVKSFLNSMFNGSVTDLVSSFVKEKDLSPDEIHDILDLIETERKKRS